MKGTVKAVQTFEHGKSAMLRSSSSEHSYLTALKGVCLPWQQPPLYHRCCYEHAKKYCEELFTAIITWTDNVLAHSEITTAGHDYISEQNVSVQSANV